MFAYLIIFIYYVFISFMFFYFIRNGSYYSRGYNGRNNVLKGILSKLVGRVNIFSCKIGSLLVNRIFFRVLNKKLDLLKLQGSGMIGHFTIESFTGYKIVLLFLFFIGGCFVGSSFTYSFISGFIGGLAGYFIPDMIVLRFNRKRQEEIERDLPDIIDLLSAATLSGQNVYNAIKIVTSKYSGRISSELSNLIRDIDTGTGKFHAYRNLIDRSNSHKFKNFIFLLMQAEKYGSSINDILKRKSGYMKFESQQKLEEEIRRKAILMLFPLVFLIMPSFIILVGGPLIYSAGGGFLNF
ncbi:MAG: type II secretion system F family protein [Actinomycetota bacterium]|nr:type II secretion system F family protein [Actinomycetota bacterium]